MFFLAYKDPFIGVALHETRTAKKMYEDEEGLREAGIRGGPGKWWSDNLK